MGQLIQADQRHQVPGIDAIGMEYKKLTLQLV
jgi:hypothetical protein